MSVQATTAVRRYSSFVKDRDFGAYRVLEAIADAADEYGVCGIAGNPKKCLSYNGIADSARVHRNTVYNLMPALLESGELEVVQQGGNGRGSWTVYRVTIIEKLSQGDVTIIQKSSQEASVVTESSQQPPESSQLSGVTIRLVMIVEELSQQVKELSQRIAESSQEKPESSQGIVTIVTSNGCDRSVESRKSSDEFREEREMPPPATPQLDYHPDCPHPQTAEETAVVTHPAIWAWQEANMAWPGFENAAYIAERLGKTPDKTALLKARQLWNLSNNKPGNAVGILDWYDELCKDPSWTPKKRFSANKAKEPAPSAGLKEIAPGVF